LSAFILRSFHCDFTLSSSFVTPVQQLVESLVAGMARGRCIAVKFS
jgi:hypothetical protein